MILKFKYVHDMKHFLDLLNFECLPRKKEGTNKRKVRRAGRERRIAKKFISALLFTVLSGILQLLS